MLLLLCDHLHVQTNQKCRRVGMWQNFWIKIGGVFISKILFRLIFLIFNTVILSKDAHIIYYSNDSDFENKKKSKMFQQCKRNEKKFIVESHAMQWIRSVRGIREREQEKVANKKKLHFSSKVLKNKFYKRMRNKN